MNRTKIEYVDFTWNPVTGCSSVSIGCKNCWARRVAKQRLRGMVGYDAENPFHPAFHENRLEEPMRVKKPSKIAVAFMGDLFHPKITDGQRRAVFDAMANAHWHTFLVLTKRAGLMVEFAKVYGRWPSNAWAGVSAEDQETADRRILDLLRVHAEVRWVSIEPMLGPIDLSRYLQNTHEDAAGITNPDQNIPDSIPVPFHDPWVRGLDWIVLGGETGPGARPMHSDWVRSVREQCQTNGVPFFFKSWGTLNSGRELDGRTWDQIPQKGGDAMK